MYSFLYLIESDVRFSVPNRNCHTFSCVLLEHPVKKLIISCIENQSRQNSSTFVLVIKVARSIEVQTSHDRSADLAGRSHHEAPAAGNSRHLRINHQTQCNVTDNLESLLRNVKVKVQRKKDKL